MRAFSFTLILLCTESAKRRRESKKRNSKRPSEGAEKENYAIELGKFLGSTECGRVLFLPSDREQGEEVLGGPGRKG